MVCAIFLRDSAAPRPSALFLISFPKGKDSMIHGKSTLLILFSNLLPSKINSHCLSLPFFPLLCSVLKALLNKSASLLINPFLFSLENVCHSLPRAHASHHLQYSYPLKLAKETTIQSKTCVWSSSTLGNKFILGDKYRNIYSSTAHNSSNLETTQMSTGSGRGK